MAHSIVQVSRSSKSPRADDDHSFDVDGIVRDVNALCKVTTLHFALAVGEVVVRKVWGGDVGRLRARGPRQDPSLRKIARHPDLAMSPSALYSCIAMYELCERLGHPCWEHVSTSHLKLVLPLNPDSQVRLLREAETRHWSTRRLEQEVASLAEERVLQRGGRKRGSPLVQATHVLQKAVNTVAEVLLQGPDAQPTLENARALTEVVRRTARTLKILEERLAQD